MKCGPLKLDWKIIIWGDDSVMKDIDNTISRNVQSIEISGIRKFFNKVSKYPDAISLTLG